jgi:hypothetical protein
MVFQEVGSDLSKREREAGQVFYLLNQLDQRKANVAEHARRSNAALYELLGETMRTGAALEADRAAVRELDRLVAKRLNRKKLSAKWTMDTKLLKFVFHDDPKRVSAYKRVLTMARADGVTPEALPTYIEQKGGVEKVRLSLTPKGKAVGRPVRLTDGWLRLYADLSQVWQRARADGIAHCRIVVEVRDDALLAVSASTLSVGLEADDDRTQRIWENRDRRAEEIIARARTMTHRRAATHQEAVAA